MMQGVYSPLKVHYIGIPMNGIAKLLDFCIGSIKNQNTISTCEFFTVFVLVLMMILSMMRCVLFTS